MSQLPPEETGLDASMLILEQDLLEMASRAEVMFVRSVEAFLKLDASIAVEIERADEKVDALDHRLEMACLDLLAKGDSSDARRIGTVLKIITDIERFADLAVDLGRCTQQLNAEMAHGSTVDLGRMAELTRIMFHRSIEAFVHADVGRIEEVVETEREVDRLFMEFRDQLFAQMRTDANSAPVLSLLLIAIHHVERAADHAENIAQRVTYLLTGNLPTHE